MSVEFSCSHHSLYSCAHLRLAESARAEAVAVVMHGHADPRMAESPAWASEGDSNAVGLSAAVPGS